MHLQKNAKRNLLGNNMSEHMQIQQVAEDCAEHMFAQDAASKALGIAIGVVKPGCATARLVCPFVSACFNSAFL